MKDELLKLYKSIYHTRVDDVTIMAYLLVLKRSNIGWTELSRAFNVNNKAELKSYLKKQVRLR